jgi:hypothetical protein
MTQLTPCVGLFVSAKRIAPELRQASEPAELVKGDGVAVFGTTGAAQEKD